MDPDDYNPCNPYSIRKSQTPSLSPQTISALGETLLASLVTPSSPWRTSEGQTLPISQMTRRHLSNTISLLARSDPSPLRDAYLTVMRSHYNDTYLLPPKEPTPKPKTSDMDPSVPRLYIPGTYFYWRLKDSHESADPIKTSSLNLNTYGLGEVLTGDDSIPFSDLEIRIDEIENWIPLLQALHLRILIPNNHNTSLSRPLSRIAFNRGYNP